MQSEKFLYSREKLDKIRMEKEIVVLDADEKECQKLCAMIEEQHYRVTPLHSLLNLEGHIQGSACLVVILDLKTVPDNRVIRELTIKHPGVYFLGISRQRFHPELREAICYHLYACLNKPVDPDEIFYWLRSIFQDEAGLKNPLES